MIGLGALQGAGEAMLRPATLLSDSFPQRAVLSQTSHRPWPLPETTWLMGQTWVDLLFAHWRVSEEALCRVVPLQLPIDTYEGSAWLGPLYNAWAEIETNTMAMPFGIELDDEPLLHFSPRQDVVIWPPLPA